MKPPATVWVVIDRGGEPRSVNEQRLGDMYSGDTIHRYRIDTPKPRKSKNRVKRG